MVFPSKLLVSLSFSFLSCLRIFAEPICVINNSDTAIVLDSIAVPAVCLWKDTSMIKNLTDGRYALLYKGTVMPYCIFSVKKFKLNGEYLSYYPNGALYGKTIYSNNEKTGIFYCFSKNGYPLDIIEFVSDKTIGWEITFDNGKPHQAILWDWPLVTQTSKKKRFLKKMYKTREINPANYFIRTFLFVDF